MLISKLLTIKLTLLFIVALICYLLGFISDKVPSLLILLSLWVCLYDVIFPIWYYHAKGKIGKASTVNFIFKIISFVLLLCFVKSPSDYLLVPIINFISVICLGLLVYIDLRKTIKFRLVYKTNSDFTLLLKESTSIFTAGISSKIYTGSSKILFGLLNEYSIVTIFDICEKIIKFLKLPSNILFQAVFPSLTIETKSKKIIRFIIIIFLIGLLSALVGFVFGEYLISLLGGTGLSDKSIIILNTLLITIPLIALNNSICNLIFLLKNKHKTIMLSSLIGLTSFIIGLNFILINQNINEASVSFLMVLAEISVSSYLLIKIYKI